MAKKNFFDGRYEVLVKILRRGVSQLIYDMLKLIEELFNLKFEPLQLKIKHGENIYEKLSIFLRVIF